MRTNGIKQAETTFGAMVDCMKYRMNFLFFYIFLPLEKYMPPAPAICCKSMFAPPIFEISCGPCAAHPCLSGLSWDNIEVMGPILAAPKKKFRIRIPTLNLFLAGL